MYKTGTKPKKERRKRPNRFDYLKLLVNEYTVSKHIGGKEEVIANLANFAYDPSNYEYLRQLKVLDIFLDLLSEVDTNFAEYSASGLSNLAAEEENAEYIVSRGGIAALGRCLKSKNEETVISSLTCLIYLNSPALDDGALRTVTKFAQSDNVRLSNLAKLFIEDVLNKPHYSQTSNSSHSGTASSA